MWSSMSKLLIFCWTHTELQNFYCVMTFYFPELFDCILEDCIKREVILKREEGSAPNTIKEVEKVVCWVAPGLLFFFFFFFGEVDGQLKGEIQLDIWEYRKETRDKWMIHQAALEWQPCIMTWPIQVFLAR